ncbi:MAG TPA: 5'/3'-nucleotidase SurE [Planctomicrobium sp.]|nr:5'/3'-nucleotidase SurE [Planctomicrobium sp.]
MKILVVNDDGIHAPGLRALSEVLRELGDVQVVAPLIEQSGVGHRITYLHPIMVKEIQEHGEHYGWAVDGSPADCVKLGVVEFCESEPDLIVSGINSGANVGINVLYSGTVAAAIEGAFFGITSIAVSLSQGAPPDYQAAAIRALHLIRQILKQSPRKGSLWNINFPNSSPEGPRGVKVTSMAVRRRSDTIEKRIDPRGRPYYWSGLDPLRNHHLEPGTDVAEMLDGYVTITPLHFDLTEMPTLSEISKVEFTL